jgi:hypothetical protein
VQTSKNNLKLSNFVYNYIETGTHAESIAEVAIDTGKPACFGLKATSRKATHLLETDLQRGRQNLRKFVSKVIRK